MRIMHRSIMVLALAALAACYEYVPSSGPTDLAAGEVRARLTDAGAVALAPTIGPQVASIDGRVSTSPDGQSYTIAVSQTTTRTGEERDWNGESVQVPASAVATFERRQLSRPRTALVSGAILGAVALGIQAAVGPGEGSTRVRPVPVPR
jgi:hypothetical protein